MQYAGAPTSFRVVESSEARRTLVNPTGDDRDFCSAGGGTHSIDRLPRSLLPSKSLFWRPVPIACLSGSVFVILLTTIGSAVAESGTAIPTRDPEIPEISEMGSAADAGDGSGSGYGTGSGGGGSGTGGTWGGGSGPGVGGTGGGSGPSSNPPAWDLRSASPPPAVDGTSNLGNVSPPPAADGTSNPINEDMSDDRGGTINAPGPGSGGRIYALGASPNSAARVYPPTPAWPDLPLMLLALSTWLVSLSLFWQSVRFQSWLSVDWRRSLKLPSSEEVRAKWDYFERIRLNAGPLDPSAGIFIVLLSSSAVVAVWLLYWSNHTAKIPVNFLERVAIGVTQEPLHFVTLFIFLGVTPGILAVVKYATATPMAMRVATAKGAAAPAVRAPVTAIVAALLALINLAGSLTTLYLAASPK